MDIPQVLAVLRPTDDWGPLANTGTAYADFAAAWRGESAVPTEAEMRAVWDAIVDAAPAAKAAAEKQAASALATATDPVSRANRAMARMMIDSIAQGRTAWNQLLAILVSGRFPTQREAAALTLPIRTWQQLLVAHRQAVANETDPNT